MTLTTLFQNLQQGQEKLSYEDAHDLAHHLLPIPAGESEGYFLLRHIESAVERYDKKLYGMNGAKSAAVSPQAVEERTKEIILDPQERTRFHLLAALDYCADMNTPEYFQRLKAISDAKNDAETDDVLGTLHSIAVNEKISPPLARVTEYMIVNGEGMLEFVSGIESDTFEQKFHHQLKYN